MERDSCYTGHQKDNPHREAQWTASVAVGSQSFVGAIKKQMGYMAIGRQARNTANFKKRLLKEQQDEALAKDYRVQNKKVFDRIERIDCFNQLEKMRLYPSSVWEILFEIGESLSVDDSQDLPTLTQTLLSMRR